MDLTIFDFELPKELIAQFPKSERSSSKLLVLPEKGSMQSLEFNQLHSYLRPGDLVILNDTKVIPARLRTKKSSGGSVEILLERIVAKQKAIVRLGGATKNIIGKNLNIGTFANLIVVSREEKFFMIETPSNSILDIFLKFGQMPLPPYIRRNPDICDDEYYQTIYGAKLGAVAAPTAGLHITENFFLMCEKNNVEVGFLTLHVGSGTYQPIKTQNIDEHFMHSEWFDIPEDICRLMLETRKNGGRIIAVGTTVLRAVESLFLKDQTLSPFSGETDIYIKPGFEFSIVDALVTNFHLPKSSLFVLACAFGGIRRVKKAYSYAINENFKFFSYGDAMYLERHKMR